MIQMDFAVGILGGGWSGKNWKKLPAARRKYIQFGQYVGRMVSDGLAKWNLFIKYPWPCYLCDQLMICNYHDVLFFEFS